MNPHPTWAILDSSKLQSFLTCPRRYFWEYLCGWRPDRPSNHLAFGTAWHAALEHCYLNGFDDIGIAEGMEKFLLAYRGEGFSEDMDEMFFPKTPSRAMQALLAYSQRWKDDDSRFEILHTEVSGTVPISDDRRLHFRLDTVIRDSRDGLIISLDHKTGSGTWGWEMEWPLKVQTGTYTHALYCLYPINEVRGLIFSGTFFLKNSGSRGGKIFDFIRAPAYRSIEGMNVWLWNVHDVIDRLEWEMERLEGCKEGDPLLRAFPLNSESCTKYGGCPYHDFCCAWANPLQRIESPPPGFMVEWWDPSSLPATEKMDLKWKGGE